MNFGHAAPKEVMNDMTVNNAALTSRTLLLPPG
jgi:hypothetical protein